MARELRAAVAVTAQVPLRLTGDVSAPARLWISLGPDPGSPRGRPTSTVVTIAAGATETTFDPTRLRSPVAQSVSGIVVGDYQGEVAVLDDDPPPRVTVSATARRSPRGGRCGGGSPSTLRSRRRSTCR